MERKNLTHPDGPGTFDIGENAGRDVSEPLFHVNIDGARYVAASVLAEKSGYGRDYIARLARQRRIRGRRLGRLWYVEEKSFWTFFIEQEVRRAERRIQLSIIRREEYLAAQHPAP